MAPNRSRFGIQLNYIRLALVGTSLLSIALTALLQYQSAQEKIDQEVHRDHQRLVALVSLQINSYLSGAREALVRTSKTLPFRSYPFAYRVDPEIHGLPEGMEPAKRDLLDVLVGEHLFSVTFILRPNGDHYLAHPFKVQKSLQKFNLADRPYFQEAVRTRRPVVSDSFVGADGVPAVAIDVPILNPAREIIAHLGGVFHLRDLAQFVSQENIPGLGYGFITDRQGRLLAHSHAHEHEHEHEHEHQEETNTERLEAVPAARRLRTTESGAHSEEVLIEHLGQNYRTALAPLEAGWILGIGTNQAHITAQIRDEVTQDLVGLIVALLIANGIGLFAIDRLGRLWVRTDEQLQQAHDDLEMRVQVRTRELEDANESLHHGMRTNRILANASHSLILHDISFQDATEIIYESARSLTQSEHGFVSEIDPRTGNSVTHNFSAMMSDACQMGVPNDLRIEPDERGLYPGLWGIPLNRRSGFFTNDPDDHGTRRLPAGHIPLKNFLSVPVIFGNDLVGQIAVANSLQPYNGQQLQDLNRLAELYAMALHRQRAQLQQEEMETRLRQSQKLESIGTLAGGIAHDFNNILGAIIGYAELSQTQVDPNSKVGRYVQSIYEASGRARDLVKQILSFSRYPGGQKVEEALDLRPVVKEALKFLRSTIPTSIEIHSAICEEEALITADITQIHQVVVNLITNAYQAIGERAGCISVTVEPIDLEPTRLPDEVAGGTFVRLAVEDDGCGIPIDIQDRVFDPYFTTKEVGKGTGLGLSIAHRITTEAGGFINVRSQVNKGTLFEILLPRVLATPGGGHDPQKASAPRRAHAGHILFVDDEQSLVELHTELLSSLGHEVSATTRPEQALEWIRQAPDAYDLVISDQTMPGLTGLDLAREAKKVAPNLPIILCTGFSATLSQGESDFEGISQVLNKPVELSTLALTIEEQLTGTKVAAEQE